jgi:LysR family transcriptional regulator, regulator for bpeEF and oprC
MVDLDVLARVIDRGTIAAAAADLGVPASTISRRIAGLERRLGVRVLERTTRRLRPTEIGELLAEKGRRVRSELDAADQLVADHQRSPRGVLRISVPTPAASDLIGPVIAEYLRRYREMRVEVIAEDRIVDLVADGYDAALRLATLSDSSLGVFRLATVGPVLAAAQSYLDRAPPLRHPRDLAEHAFVAFGKKRKQTVRFVRGEATVDVEVAPRAVATNAQLVARISAGGIGLALIPQFTAIAAGLVVVEPGGYRPAAQAFSIVTPSARTIPPKVRAFVDIMRDHMATCTEMFDSVVPRKETAKLG